MAIAHEQFQNGGSFYLGGAGDPIAEMTYRRVGSRMIIDHTEVDEALEGQGVARRLLDAAVAYAREHGETLVPLCPYARSQFEADPTILDVLGELPATPPR